MAEQTKRTFKQLSEQENLLFKNFINVVDCESSDNKIIKEKEMERFWAKRKVDACIWGMVVTSVNVGF